MNFFPANNDKILIDDVGKYSITLPDKTKIITNLISKYLNSKDIIVTDAMACIGGDTLSFSKEFKSVNAIELDKTRFEYLKHNMSLFDCTNITFYNDDYLKLIAPILNNIADVVIGSRFIGADEKRVLFYWHSLGNKILTTLSNSFSNLNLTDMDKTTELMIIVGIGIAKNGFL
jgi:hypothetical protein